VIHNLEIRLGCVHRGVEQTLTRVPWQKARFVAEAASSDTAVGNALAHALAIEQILGIQAPPRAQWLRGIALEIERAASHIGDLAGISGDIGFSGPAGIFAHLRGAALGLQERLTGSRLGTAYVTPGGVVRPLSSTDIQEVKGCVEWLAAEIGSAVPLLMDNSGAIERMESTGRVRHAVALSFGLVGPAGRASGLDYDVRQSFPLAPYTSTEWMVASGTTGDVLARAQVRVHEIAVSLQLLKSFLDNMPEGPHQATTLPSNLPALCVGVGIVEAWRGELIHLAFTGEDGRISRYCIKDPSFNNWTGLSVAVRGEVLADFPLCNKSFGLSYSGNDL
jgi:Ni,Fe-hydrogenase III large subunit